MFRFSGIALALALALASGPLHSGLLHAEAAAPGATAGAPAAGQTVTVFAAASLKNALDAAAAAFKAKTGVELNISYASSMALAKQIESGAPAEVFFPADQASMDYLAGKGLIKADTRADLLGNSLVVVAPQASKLSKLDLTKDAFEAAIGSGKVATGDPASVPVGKYARASLEKLDLWSTIEPHFAFTDNVRAALMFVSREEATLGVVYATDAKSEPKAKIVATFPAHTHPPIVYPVALTSTATGDGAATLLAFLKSEAAKHIFAEQGFIVPK